MVFIALTVCICELLDAYTDHLISPVGSPDNISLDQIAFNSKTANSATEFNEVLAENLKEEIRELNDVNARLMRSVREKETELKSLREQDGRSKHS